MKMFSVQTRTTALKTLFSEFEEWQPAEETVPLAEAAGRILAMDVHALEDLPPFRRSTVDGYAVRAGDTIGASESSPGLLHLLGAVEMGKPPEPVLMPDSVIYVPTGGAIPEGADAMVMIEFTEPFGTDIAIHTAAAVNDHVVGIGEDVPKGSPVLNKGDSVRVSHLGLLASLGITELKVYVPVRVAVLSTGNELVLPAEEVLPGQVRDSNRIALCAMVKQFQCSIVMSELVRDNAVQLQSVLEEALNSADVVLLSGGSSVGVMDYTEDVLASFGEPGILTHGLAIKPGKPTLIAKLKGRAVFGLPGHPAACAIVFAAVVAPFLKFLTGSSEPVYREVPCVSNFQLHTAGGRDMYQLVQLVKSPDGLLAEAIFGKSGMVSQMAKADAFVVIPMSSEGVKVGDRLWAFLLP